MVSTDSGMVVEYRFLARFPWRRFGSDGSVWSRLQKSRWGNILPEWRRLKASPGEDGYPSVRMRSNDDVDGKCRLYRVARLTAEAFYGPCPPGMECLHWDGNPANGAATNLRWGTSAENKADMLRHGTRAVGMRNGRAKLTEEAKAEMRLRFAAGERKADLARSFRVDPKTVSGVVGFTRPSVADVPVEGFATSSLGS